MTYYIPEPLVWKALIAAPVSFLQWCSNLKLYSKAGIVSLMVPLLVPLYSVALNAKPLTLRPKPETYTRHPEPEPQTLNPPKNPEH